MEMAITAYSNESTLGIFVLRLWPPLGCWRIEHQGEVLGTRYSTAQQALDDVCGGHCDWVGNVDPSTLGLPEDIGDWTPFAATR